MSYSLKKNENQYSILEIDSGTLIQVGTDYNNARITCRKLNLGFGFQGWTPLFFSKKNISTNLQ